MVRVRAGLRREGQVFLRGREAGAAPRAEEQGAGGCGAGDHRRTATGTPPR